AFSYPRWPISAADLGAYLWLFVTAAAGAAIYFARRYVGRGLEVAALFFVATLSPVLGFIMLYTFRYTWVADHYQYLASIGPLALAAAGLTAGLVALQRKIPFVVPLICGALLLSLLIKTWRQGAIYRDEEMLWR
ncbi:MAG: hypothetical protein ABR589_10095, partial [Chthoniobacterales bacterium]